MSSALSTNTMSTPTPTQADNLRRVELVSIVTRNDPCSVWGFKHWLFEVKLALTNLNLLAVISREIQRPTPDHPNYQTNSAIILSTHRGIQFADEMFQYIEFLQSIEEAMAKRAEFNTLWSMTRDQFHNLHDYISAWSAQAMFCAQFEPAFCWYAATKMILGEIKEELPNLQNFIDRQLQTGIASRDQFRTHLTIICGALKQRN
ncbi:unnamed protein product [Penicillium palitans]